MRGVPLAVLVLLAACSPSADSNESQANRSAGGPAATLVLAAGADCTAQWDGQSMSPKALGGRAFALLSKHVDAAGGPAAITLGSLPYLRLEAPPATPWPCAGEVLASLQRAGFAEAALRPTGLGDAPEQRLQLPHGDITAPTPDRLINVGAGGAIQLDGQLRDRPALRDFARANASGGPNDFVIAPDAVASFGDVYQTLSDLRSGNASVMLAGAPSSTSGPPPPPMPPMPPMPPPDASSGAPPRP